MEELRVIDNDNEWEDILMTSSEKDSKKRVYIAYGSNMDICRMDKRCKDFEFYGIGYICNYRLTFQQSVSGFYANLIPVKSKKIKEYIPVVLYLISEEDEKQLDKYEGYPSAYRKKEIKVELEGKSSITGLVYILPAKKSYGIPTFQYYRLISNAYKIFGFDLNTLKNALVYSYRRAKTKINKNQDSLAIKTKKTDSEQIEFIDNFNSRILSDSNWEMIIESEKILLKNRKFGDKQFEVIINKDKSIGIKDLKNDSISIVENLDRLIEFCSKID